VGNQAGNSVTVYDLPLHPDASGNVTPSRVIQGPDTQLGTVATVATDATGRIYVANDRMCRPEAGAINVYSPGARDDAMPEKIIDGSALAGADFGGLAVDRDGEVFAHFSNHCSREFSEKILVFPAGAGSTPPSRRR
jgi:hypothetical protein